MSNQHYNWKPGYELGIEEIDLQHHYFLDLINRLLDVLNEEEDTRYQAALIAELNAYARFHFISEENMMARAAYPGLDEHKKLHTDLLSHLSIKETELDIEPSREGIKNIVDFLVHWFVHHSTKEDKHFADYLHNEGGT